MTLETAREAGGPIAALMHDIAGDEQRWCAMLLRQLEALGARRSDAVGDFYGKAMAIADLDARIAFINRGQGWVVRKLREMLPRVRDDGLLADLVDMLQSHETNISRANEAIGS